MSRLSLPPPKVIAFAASTSVPVTPLSLTVSRVCARRPRLPRACYAPNDGGGSTGAFRSSAARGVSLRVFERTWSPAPSAPAPSAGLLILPGGRWHSGWFGELARALAERAGCRVVGLDFLGNGKSDSIDGLRSYMRELEDHLGDARKSLEGLGDGLPDGTPLFVLSESQGGIEAAMLALETTGVVEDVAGWVGFLRWYWRDAGIFMN